MAERDDYTSKIDDLIDEFPEDLFIELCEEMIDRATTARDARQEETLEFDPEDDD